MPSSLESFFDDISKCTLLTREEEIHLSQLIEKGDSRARDKMIRSNIRLAISIAKKYQHKGCDLEDLIQESNIGLMKAVDRYDWRRGFKFSTYACWWIKQAVRRHITSHSASVKLPSYAKSMLWKMKNIREEYLDEFGHIPTDEEVADLLGVSIKTIRNMDHCSNTTMSLDQPIKYRSSQSEGRTLREIIPEVPDKTMDDIIDDQKMCSLIRKAMTTLSRREEQVIRLRFGISEPKDSTKYFCADNEGEESR